MFRLVRVQISEGPLYYTYCDLRSTPFSKGLLNFNAINHIVSHSEPGQSNMAHYRELHSMNAIVIGGEVIQSCFFMLSSSTAITLLHSVLAVTTTSI